MKNPSETRHIKVDVEQAGAGLLIATSRDMPALIFFHERGPGLHDGLKVCLDDLMEARGLSFTAELVANPNPNQPVYRFIPR